LEKQLLEQQNSSSKSSIPGNSKTDGLLQKYEADLGKESAKIRDMTRQYERFKKEADELKEKLDAQQKENEYLISEIGVIEGEYNTKDAENRKITKQLAQSEDTNINLVSERIKLTQAHTLQHKKMKQ